MSSEATYLLPKGSEEQFPEFFKKFDSSLKQLKVSSYGISMTTLEEVFLKVETHGKEGEEEIYEMKKRLSLSNSQENKIEKAYSISKEQISGYWSVFFLHFFALLLKKLILSKRNIKGLLVDLLVPILLIIIGVGLSTISFYRNSAQRPLSPTLFPNPQRVMFNTNPVAGGGSPADIINLINSPESFEFKGIQTQSTDDISTLEVFDTTIFNAGKENPLKPYRFGNYFFHTVNLVNNIYKVVSFVNSTSQDAPAAFPNFIYEAILRKATGVNDLSFTTVNDPMPVVQIWLDNDKGNNSFVMTLIIGIAFSLIPTSLISFLLIEKFNQLVHQQTISGMNKAAYWISSFCFDILKVLVPVLVCTLFLKIFGLDVEYGWLLLLLFPFALVPYTYATSFMFSSESSAVNFTIFHNFIISGFFPILANVFRLFESMRTVGDIMVWLPRFIPSFNLVGGIANISFKNVIANMRGVHPPPGPLAFEVAGPDVVLLVVHFFFWNMVIILIECGVFN